MKTILILANNDMGLYKFRKELLLSLTKKYKVIVLIPGGPYIADIEALGCEVQQIDLDRRGMNPINELKLFFQYQKTIKRINPSCILLYTIKPNIYGGIAARMNKIPCLANITGMGTALGTSGPTQKLLIQMYKLAFKNIHTVFFQNKPNMDFFLDNKIIQTNGTLIPGSGVNLTQFTQLPYPSDETAIKFVFISRIMKEKGIDEYLTAAERIKAEYKNVEFHICGFLEDDYVDKLKTYESVGVINYHGLVPDISQFLKDMHCTIHPSYYPEGISNVLLESAASCRPIITTDQPGCKDVVKEDGFNGYIFEAKQTDQLVEKIRAFIQLSYSEKQQMGINGRKFVSEKFDRDIVVNRYLQTIEEIVHE
ncbi:glycosyltransferase family 4 protein [Enterococcus xiangfangensis]|uniref:Glycosyltransferase family 4 protein n=1 Tax=Enterococcus xiangfangensis TaxID=1296537 RepID=A0ABU3FA95_9ENTE|nr:glycosyltransferase family 4 protein [Enterococcus xiangfangensis]MDT2759589.1 glycosyltransferase family 4 protein [Enterococcus xiangfangensis]